MGFHNLFIYFCSSLGLLIILLAIPTTGEDSDSLSTRTSRDDETKVLKHGAILPVIKNKAEIEVDMESGSTSNVPATKVPVTGEVMKVTTTQRPYYYYNNSYAWIYMVIGGGSSVALCTCHLCRKRKCCWGKATDENTNSNTCATESPEMDSQGAETESQNEFTFPDILDIEQSSQSPWTLVPNWQQSEQPNPSFSNEGETVELSLNRITSISRRIYLPTTMKPTLETVEEPPPAYNSLFPEERASLPEDFLY